MSIAQESNKELSIGQKRQQILNLWHVLEEKGHALYNELEEKLKAVNKKGISLSIKDISET